MVIVICEALPDGHCYKMKDGQSPIDIVMVKNLRSSFPDGRSPIALNYFLHVLTKLLA